MREEVTAREGLRGPASCSTNARTCVSSLHLLIFWLLVLLITFFCSPGCLGDRGTQARRPCLLKADPPHSTPPPRAPAPGRNQPPGLLRSRRKRARRVPSGPASSPGQHPLSWSCKAAEALRGCPEIWGRGSGPAGGGKRGFGRGERGSGALLPRICAWWQLVRLWSDCLRLSQGNVISP